MPTGRVLAFENDRGLGEIEDDSGVRYPFHATQLADGARTIAVGSPVSFEIIPGLPGRWEAAGIQPRAPG